MNSLFVLAFLAPSLLWASTPKNLCANCGKIQELERKITTLNFVNLDERDRGADDVPAVHAMLQDFAKSQAPDRNQEFRALLHLAAAALPYDVETSVASAISDLVANPELKKIYLSSLNEINDQCRRSFLASAVEEHICVEDHGEDCLRTVDYEECSVNTHWSKD